MYTRSVIWTLLIVLGAYRPGVDLFDRGLVSATWRVPSQWNAIADAAIRTGAIDGRFGEAPAPWRQASVDASSLPPVAVVIVSDLKRARVAFVSDHYENLGGFERVAGDPSLITDQARGYKPLSHIWPIVARDGRLHTLIGFTRLVSAEPNAGPFAYVAVGSDDTELLFVCQLSWGPGPSWGVLARLDLDNDGFEDFAFYPRGRKDQRPLAAFLWDPRDRKYGALIGDEGRRLISWWSTKPEDRIIVSREAILDIAVGGVLRRLTKNP